jgi:hypothetical protein
VRNPVATADHGLTDDYDGLLHRPILSESRGIG